MAPFVDARVVADWQDYALLDSGGEEKLERFGDVLMIRPDPQALWGKGDERAWGGAALSYARQGREGEWNVKKPVPSDWEIGWEDLRFRIRPTSFKHTGLFPEQASNWAWLRSGVLPKGAHVLNLFGYTGGATLAAASAGAEVTHVDASKPVVTWTKENLELSGLGEAGVRLIVDDAVKFVGREARRGKKYDAVLLDPPAFGRGPTGELWKFETGLPPLLHDIVRLLSPEGGALLLNAYSLGFSALVLENLLQSAFPWEVATSTVQLCLREQGARGFLLPAGVAVRVTWGSYAERAL